MLTKAIVWIPLQCAGVQHNGTSLVLVCLADLDVLLLNMMVKYSHRKSLETTQQIFTGLVRFCYWRAAHSSVIWESCLPLAMYTFCASTSNHMWCLIHSGVIWQCSFSVHICLHFFTDFSPLAPLPLLSLPSPSLPPVFLSHPLFPSSSLPPPTT